MKIQGEIEPAICERITRFEQECRAVAQRTVAPFRLTGRGLGDRHRKPKRTAHKSSLTDVQIQQKACSTRIRHHQVQCRFGSLNPYILYQEFQGDLGAGKMVQICCVRCS
jgi:hypothetical protein